MLTVMPEMLLIGAFRHSLAIGRIIFGENMMHPITFIRQFSQRKGLITPWATRAIVTVNYLPHKRINLTTVTVGYRSDVEKKIAVHCRKLCHIR